MLHHRSPGVGEVRMRKSVVGADSVKALSWWLVCSGEDVHDGLYSYSRLASEEFLAL
jgi:hypothetical protein